MDKIDLALLHGGGQGSWVWQETIAALHSQCADLFRRILALDIPGCGTKRGRATQHLEREDVARELIADLESAGIRQCVLAGHSLAGNVLPAMAELRPNLFRRLIYVSCSIPSTGQTVLELLGSRLHGSSENEVGWPVDPKTTSVRDRYDAMFCEDMSETQRTKFLEQLGHDEWPQKFFSATRFTFDTFSLDSRNLCRLSQGSKSSRRVAGEVCRTLPCTTTGPYRRRPSSDDHASAHSC